MIEGHIEEALKVTGLESYYLYRTNELQECIVYSYTYKPAIKADNEVLSYEYSILLNTYVSLEKDITAVRDKVIGAMAEAGYKLQPVPTPQKEKDLINIALRFKIAM